MWVVVGRGRPRRSGADVGLPGRLLRLSPADVRHLHPGERVFGRPGQRPAGRNGGLAVDYALGKLLLTTDFRQKDLVGDAYHGSVPCLQMICRIASTVSFAT